MLFVCAMTSSESEPSVVKSNIVLDDVPQLGPDESIDTCFNHLWFADFTRDTLDRNTRFLSLFEGIPAEAEKPFRDCVLESGIKNAEAVVSECERFAEGFKDIKLYPEQLTVEDTCYLRLLGLMYDKKFENPMLLINDALNIADAKGGFPEETKGVIFGIFRALNKIPYEDLDSVFMPFENEEQKKVALISCFTIGFVKQQCAVEMTKTILQPGSYKMFEVDKGPGKALRGFVMNMFMGMEPGRDAFALLPGWVCDVFLSEKKDKKAADVITLTVLKNPPHVEVSPKAMCRLAESYIMCQTSTISDRRAAALLYIRASDTGDLSATMKAAICYRRGFGVMVNNDMAEKLFTRASEKGCASAKVNLGMIYASQAKVSKELSEKAAAMFRDAAKLGSVGGVYNLGVCYMLGFGVPKNVVKGRELMYHAAMMDNPAALLNMSILASESISRKVRRKGSMDCLKRAADVGDGRSMALLSNACLVDGSYDEGLKFLKHGVLKRCPCAVNNMGLFYASKKFGREDKNKAITYWRLGSKATDTLSMYNLAICSWNGWGIPQNKANAIVLWEKAARKGHRESMARLLEACIELGDKAKLKQFKQLQDSMIMKGQFVDQHIR